MVVPTAEVGRGSLVNRRPEVKEELWLCMSQICKDRYVFFFDCSEEADRGIDQSDFSG